MASSRPAVVLHTTPPLAPLPASDAESIRLLCTLRLGGVRAGVETAEWSANGKPFVTLNGVGLRARYFPSLPNYTAPDARLSDTQRADAAEWTAFIDGQVTDLVNHSLYSLPANYAVVLRAQLAALSFPQSHYVPQRILGVHAARLRAVGLWGVGGGGDDENTPAEPGLQPDKTPLEDAVVVAPGGTRAPRAWSGWNAGVEAAERKRKFGEEKIRQRARAAFDPLARKLGAGMYFFGSRPSSLDIALFAQLALVLDTSLPAPLLCDLLLDEYPTLVSHHERMLEAFPDGWKGVQRLPAPPAPTLWSTLAAALPWSSSSTATSSASPSSASIDGENKSKDERRKEAAQLRKFRYARWAWFAGAGLALVTYMLASGLVDISFDDADEEDEDEDEEEGEWAVEEDVDGEGEGGEAPTDLYAFMGYRGGGLPVADDDDEEEETAAE